MPFFEQFHGGARHVDGMDRLNRAFGHLGLAPEPPRRAMSQRFRGLSQLMGRNPFGGLRRAASDRGPRDISVPGYRVIRSLKTGGMSEAILVVKSNRTGRQHIAKRVPASGSRRSRAMAELHALQQIRSGGNLNYMIDHIWLGTGRSNLIFILEYCDGGSLDDKLQESRKRGGQISEKFLWHVIVEIAKALAYLHWGTKSGLGNPVIHWNTIVHMDVKPQNIFCSYEGKSDSSSYPRIVLGDFGCATSLKDIADGRSSADFPSACTPAWLPNELRHSSRPTRFGPSADIFMLGATIQTLCLKLYDPNRSRLGTNAAVGRTYGRALNEYVGLLSRHYWRDRPDALKIVRDVSRRR